MSWSKGNWSKGGIFTKSLLSLQVQVEGLLEGVGGSSTASLLDGLAELTEKERELVLPVLIKAVQVIAQRPNRLRGERDESLRDFEEGLFGSLAAALNGDPAPALRNDEQKQPNPLALLDGGKDSRHNVFRKPVRVSNLVNLRKARENRVYRTGTKGDTSKLS